MVIDPIDLLTQRVQRLERVCMELILDIFGDLPENPPPFEAAPSVDAAEVARMRTRAARLDRLGKALARLRT